MGNQRFIAWLMDPNMPGGLSAKSASSGNHSAKISAQPIAPPSWIRDSMFFKLRLNNFGTEDIETMTIRRATVPGGAERSPFLKVFILLKAGEKVESRVPGDEFRIKDHEALAHKGAGNFIDNEFLDLYKKDPTTLNRMLSLKMKRQRDGSFLIIHNDNPLKLAPPRGYGQKGN